MQKFWLSAALALLIFLTGAVYFYCTIGSDYTADLFLDAAQWSLQNELDRPAELLYHLALRFNRYSSEARLALADLYEARQQPHLAEALLTDGIRGSLLEACGYKTQLLEFVDLTHSPKNILIRAVKSNVSAKKKQASLDEVKRSMETFSVEPTLYRLLSEAGKI